MVAELVAELDDTRVWDWTKNPKQDTFVWDRSKEAVWIGGRGSTKTSSASFRILTTCYDIDTGAVRPDWRGARIAIFAPISKQLKGGPLEKFDEIFGEMGLILHKVNGHDPRRELAGDITVYAFNVAKDGSGIEATRGAEYAIIWLDEAAQMPEKVSALGDALLRQKHRNNSFYDFQFIITSTPRGKNWLHTQYMSKVPTGPGMWGRNGALIIRSTTKESIEAGILPEDYARKYTPGTLMYQQEILGETVSWGGLVFPDFDFTKHVYGPDIPPFLDTPPLHFVYGGIDIGTADPTCLLVGGIDASGGVWITEEYYERRARFDDWADLCGAWDKKYAVRGWMVDSDLTVRMMQHAGLQARAPYKAQDAASVAINYINGKFAKGELHIHARCKNLIRELETYHHKEGDYDERTGEQTILGTISTGQDDHAVDAFRYLIFPLSSAAADESEACPAGSMTWSAR